MKRDLSTEEKIKAAAKKVFMTKGFDGCSVRDIAKEVGSNVALLNYYFRSKEKLFELIFEGAMSDFLQSMIEVFSSNLTLQEKLEQLIDKEFEFFMEHPELPMFILQSLHQNKTDAPMPSHFLEPIAKTGIFEQFELAKAKGEIRDISIRNMTMLLMSNVHYPFMSKKLTEQFHGIDAEIFEADLIKHKAIVKELIIHYLFISNPKA
ncbi:MAG: TetR/AcrR family transcriptional regulator [Crocinitomicaceae bacterium]